jgi:hypothetical protein
MYTKRAPGDINIYAMNEDLTTQKLSKEEKKQLTNRRWYEANKERHAAVVKRNYELNREKYLARNKARRAANREEYRAKCRAYIKKRYETEPDFRLKEFLRSRMHAALKAKRITKTERSIELLGCTIDEFRAHIEKQWLPGMTWENHTYKGWHIDHIKPVNTFDFTDLEQQKQCFHYTNLRPLWGKDNNARPNDGSDIV